MASFDICWGIVIVFFFVMLWMAMALYNCSKKKESILFDPTYYQSVLFKEQDHAKDVMGMTLNDYRLENRILTDKNLRQAMIVPATNIRYTLK